MIKRLLVANRGEIALRIIRACQEMDIETVAIYSVVDKDQAYVKFADYSVCIGGAKSSESYLQIENIINIAKIKKCDAIHPGYGFLSENVNFVKRIEEEGLIFVGPNSKTIDLMGDKVRARELMKKHGVNIVPGSIGEIQSYKDAENIAKNIGYPLLIKAAGGGGGKGMRRVYTKEDLKSKFESAQQEALASFNNKKMYIEKLIEKPRHIEIQILADKYSNILSLFERNCSIQRNNQKLIEEAPAFNIPQKVRDELRENSIKAVKACNYENAGTIEYIMDKDNNFYFIEMNTRIQVEHPVTEMITGVDIVREQLRIASGFRLKYTQKEINIKGYAIECRLNAESPLDNFMPQSGKINYLYKPGGVNVRFDSSLYSGVEISPYYDSMIGKIIVFDHSRIGAIRKMRRAVQETIVEGIKTNLYFLYAILYNQEFIRGNYNTSFLEKNLNSLLKLMEENK
ncbi:MAG: acetyl-CoA carboxylase biotin carboxylase subunit [Peptoniphilaceae bacterium]